MTQVLADLPFAALYAVMLGWAIVRGTFFYALGASTHLEHPLVQRFVARVTRGPLLAAEDRVAALGGRAIAVTYVVPGVAAATQVVAGMAGLSRSRFAIGFLAAAAPWAVLEALAGDAVITAFTSSWGLWLGIVAALVVLVRWSRPLSRRSAERLVRRGRVRGGQSAPVSMPA